MRNIYHSLALIFFNSVILVIMALILLWCALEIRHLITGRGHVVISDAIKFDSFSLTPQSVAKETVSEFNAYASSHPFVFNPWTTFMLAPVAGKHLNVVEGPLFNHRITVSENTGSARDKITTIWSFGGSTLYGFGVPDSQSIPSHLQRILNETGNLGTVRVVNFGQPYWFSSVEFAAYSAMLDSDRRPDIVLFLDGLNDMANLISGRTTPFFTNQANAAWERRRRDARRMLPWLSINESFPVSRVARYIESRFQVKSEKTLVFRPTKTLNSNQVVSVFMENIKKIRALSDAYNVKSFFFLQPIPWIGVYEADAVSQNFPFGDRKTLEASYKGIKHQFSNQTDTIDLHEALLSQKAPFVDNIHYSDSANALLAKYIARSIVGSINKTPHRKVIIGRKGSTIY